MANILYIVYFSLFTFNFSIGYIWCFGDKMIPL